MAKVRRTEDFRDGHQDGLEPLSPIDLNACESVSELLVGMSGCSFGARRLGEAADVLEAMIRDEDCYKVLTISGALTVAKMQLVFIELIERGWVDAVVATGALVAHGFIEGTGMTHFKDDGTRTDEELFELGYDRVYDTLELEKNFHFAALMVRDIFAKPEYDGASLKSPEICRIIGRHLVENDIGEGSILKSAYRKDVPIYIPALNDSELGLDLISLRYAPPDGSAPATTIEHAALEDVIDFADRVQDRKTLGIFTLGGGVPRNWAQQIGPFIELKRDRQQRVGDPFPAYFYGVRICPDPVHLGGLSGCTYSEGMSWGKFDPEGRFAEVFTDATMALPILVRALIERLGG